MEKTDIVIIVISMLAYRKSDIKILTMALTIRNIRYFIAAADSGKLSQAAKNVHISQSAITTAINALEAHLGVQLFDRHSKGSELTREGYEFLFHAKKIWGDIQDAEQSIGSGNSSVEGLLKVGVTYTVAGYFLTTPLMRFQLSFPNIEIEIFELERDEIEKQLVLNTLSIGVIPISNLVRVDQIETDLLVSAPRRLWVSAAHDLTGEREISLRDIETTPYIMITVDEVERTTIELWDAHGHSPNVIFRTSSLEAVRDMVAHGFGVTILSDMVYRPWSLDGARIEAIPIAETLPNMDIGFAWSRETKLPECADAFRVFVRSQTKPKSPDRNS